MDHLDRGIKISHPLTVNLLFTEEEEKKCVFK